MPGHDLREGLGPGMAAGRGTRPAVHHDRDARLGEQPPYRRQEWIGRVVAADLHVRLEDAGPDRECRLDVRAAGSSAKKVEVRRQSGVRAAKSAPQELSHSAMPGLCG